MGIEDAYITFRVARNWSQGLGPYFNVGLHAGSVTSLPWTAWLALGLETGADPLVWARITSLACDLFAVWCAWRVLKHHVWAFGVLYAMPWFAAASASGLEAPAVSAALVASTTLPVHGMLAALRPEGLPLALIMSRRRHDVLLSLAGFAVVAFANFAFFAAVFPTAQAKAQVYGIHPLAATSYLVPLLPWLDTGQVLNGARWLAPIMLAGVIIGWRGHWRMSIAVLGPILGYFAIGATYFWWYTVPCLALSCVTSAQLLELRR